MKKFIFFTAVLCLATFGFAAQDIQANEKITVIKPYFQSDYIQQIERLYHTKKSSHSKNIAQRVAADSAYFLGKPYVLGNLGEGPKGKFDKDPLFRTDEFDCQTYASTVLALTNSNNVEKFLKTINKVRYIDGTPEYVMRDHFVSVDWNRQNQINGYLKNITQQLFPKRYKVATAVINKPGWYDSKKANELIQFHSLSKQQTQNLLDEFKAQGRKTHKELSRLSYVPLTALYKNGQAIKAMFDRIPSGVIIEIVRPNWNLQKFIGTHLNISHLGFGIRVNGVLMYREASSIEKKVTDIPLKDYLKGYLKSKTVKGIHIEQVI